MATVTSSSQEKLRVSSDPSSVSLEVLYPKKKKCHNKIPPSMRNNFYLNHPDLSRGQKKYLWSICSIYSTSQMKQLVQEQFLNQLFYEMEKGIIKTADWPKYIEYIVDPSKRKHQFQSLSAKHWKAPADQYKFRYYRDHPVALPAPLLPVIVDEEIKKATRPPPTPRQRSLHYVSRRRRKAAEHASYATSQRLSRKADGEPGQLPGHFPSGQRPRQTVVVPPLELRPATSMGFHSNRAPTNDDSISSEIPSFSSNFTGSSNGGSDGDMANRTIGEGLTRPKSRIGSRQRAVLS